MLINLRQITRVNGLTASEDGIIIRLSILTQYWRVTDGRMDGVAVAKTALSIAARCKNRDSGECYVSLFSFVIFPSVSDTHHNCNDRFRVIVDGSSAFSSSII